MQFLKAYNQALFRKRYRQGRFRITGNFIYRRKLDHSCVLTHPSIVRLPTDA